MRCIFHDIEGGIWCERCNRVVRTKSRAANTRADCRAYPRWHEWGYWAALFLGELGITEHRYVVMRKRLGLAPTCGCQRREEAMNRWGERLRSVVGRLVRR